MALPIFNRACSTVLFGVGQCSHGISILQVTWPQRTRRIQTQGVDRVDPSPRDQWLQHVRKIRSKWTWSKDLPDDTWKAQNRLIVINAHPSSIVIVVFIRMHGRRWCSETMVTSHRTADAPRNHGLRDRAIVTIHLTWSSIQRRRKFVEELHDRGPIKPRSRHDRAAIVEISSWNRFHGIRRRPTEIQDHDRSTIVARSQRDHVPIVVRSWLLLRLIWGIFHLKFGSNDAAPENHSHDPAKPLPQPPLLPSKSGLIFPLKVCISPLCSSTFDRFVKKLSEFRGRS